MFILLFKKFLQQPCRLLGSNSAVDCRLVSVSLFKQIDHAAARAGVFVLCAENDRWDTRIYYRPGAHRARLKRDIYRAAAQPPIADRAARFAYGLDLGMMRCVVALLALVSASSDYISVRICYDAADGYLPFFGRARCKRKCVLHVFFSVHMPPPGMPFFHII